MILRKYMSLLGIGSAKIDLILEKEIYKAGDLVRGNFSIEGGTIEQKLKRVECDLLLTDHAAGVEKVIDTTTILTARSINSEEAYNLPFCFKLPAALTASTDELSYRFQTRLVFDEGVTSQDQDIIQVI
ncbi:sporulation protein [Metabacillus fastidiosus]|uniref:sporulation protein n=1 Tax=Metabacillus fastidiosus TaxID=1458 RepID=UPI002E1A4B41|nr:sporulation protein [Metabacillus fastidiosus]